MKKYDYVIAVDPDALKSGVAGLSTHDKSVLLLTLEFPLVIDFIIRQKEHFDSISQNLIVLVEASWLIQHNWHANKHQSHRVAAAIGNKTGRNHETGRKIVEMCKHYGIEVQEIRPLKKCWKGKDGKISHEEISYFIPGFPKRSNQEERDSALLCWNYCNYPIKVKPIQSKRA